MTKTLLEAFGMNDPYPVVLFRAALVGGILGGVQLLLNAEMDWAVVVVMAVVVAYLVGSGLRERRRLRAEEEGAVRRYLASVGDVLAERDAADHLERVFEDRLLTRDSAVLTAWAHAYLGRTDDRAWVVLDETLVWAGELGEDEPVRADASGQTAGKGD